MIEELIHEFQKKFDKEIVSVKILKEKEGIFCKEEVSTNKKIVIKLEEKGIDALFEHQADAIRCIREGKNVIIVAGTAGGKTLCYNIPVLEELEKAKKSRALYIFPTKALTQDQLRKFRELSSNRVVSAIYDGDTPVNMRNLIRKKSRVIFSNPDMLHYGILPNHKKWGELFLNLKYVVIDDAHIYKGVFGGNVALVLRRLRRIA
ncbi:MAG: DEAD/DEAH box helicase, partial [Actinomycetia bacterium]|nr:DEAD/DEAH box helicase [Actinomycetes bacterium]